MNNQESIERNVATNIAMLRKSKGWKQSEFAFKINFSDKSVSKWERGESMPDITTLKEIADVFGVSVDYLLAEHKTKDFVKRHKEKFSVRDLLVTCIFAIAVFFIATIIFISAYITKKPDAGNYWVSFVYALTLCAVIAIIYMRAEHYWLGGMISVSCLVWFTLTSIYLTTLVAGYPQFWMIFIVGLPIQAAICLTYFMKKY